MKLSNWMAVISALILFLLIFNIKKSHRFNQFDVQLHHKLVRNHDGFSWQVIAFLNDPKLMVIWAVLLASFLINQEKNIAALWVLATLGFTDLTGILLKKAIHRARPLAHSDLENGYSFPSGHVLGSTVMSLILMELFGKEFGIGFIIFLAVVWIMVIVSRLRLQAHYPSDILGAASLAVFCFSISQQILAAII